VTSATSRWVSSALLQPPNAIEEYLGWAEQPRTTEPSGWITRDTATMYSALLGMFVTDDPIHPTTEPSSRFVMSCAPTSCIADLAISLAASGPTKTSTGVPEGSGLPCDAVPDARLVARFLSDRMSTIAPPTHITRNTPRKAVKTMKTPYEDALADCGRGAEA
jgi:hypothetical protein